MKLTSLYFLVGLSFFTLNSFAEQYNGSSFSEVWNVITGHDQFLPKDEESLKEYSVYQSQQLPHYLVTNASIFAKDKTALERDAQRTLNEKFDYYDRLPKRLHPNGVCVAGEWTIFTPSDYTGYFANGSKGLFIGRISASMGETEAGKKRGIGLAGKIYPTLNTEQIAKPAHFFTVDVLLGTKAPHALEAKTTNQPEIGFDISLFGLLLKVSSALSKSGQSPTFRPLNEIGNLKLNAGLAKYPKWMRLSVVTDNLKLNEQKDLRNEILQAMTDNSEIRYNIEVSETTNDRLTTTGWTKLGEIKLNKAIVSYGCDRRLHFAHPSEK